MIYHQIIKEVERLSLKERLELLEFLRRSVQKEVAAQAGTMRQSVLPRVLGILKTQAETGFDDWKIKEDYAEYLIRKYS